MELRRSRPKAKTTRKRKTKRKMWKNRVWKGGDVKWEEPALDGWDGKDEDLDAEMDER
jgi:hypothetical protein